jgi:hypothetical protein
MLCVPSQLSNRISLLTSSISCCLNQIAQQRSRFPVDSWTLLFSESAAQTIRKQNLHFLLFALSSPNGAVQIKHVEVLLVSSISHPFDVAVVVDIAENEVSEICSFILWFFIIQNFKRLLRDFQLSAFQNDNGKLSVPIIIVKFANFHHRRWQFELRWRLLDVFEYFILTNKSRLPRSLPKLMQTYVKSNWTWDQTLPKTSNFVSKHPRTLCRLNSETLP